MDPTIGTRIKQYRAQNGLTADAFGRKVGRDRQAVYGWESGKTDPNAAALFRLADLGIITTSERDALIRGDRDAA